MAAALRRHARARATCSATPASSRSWSREAPAAVEELAEWGCAFARTDDGRIDQRFFGAHRWRRTCYAGDYSGRAILHTLGGQGRRSSASRSSRSTTSSRLLIADGACFGALAFDLHDGSRTAFVADAVVLCGGGHTRIWRRSSSRRDENFGEAMALALRAGCRVMDMELVQFHPTGMVAPEEAAGTLVTEAVRGEGGHLYNADGERFMARYDAERMELSTRDRVALANYTEIAEGRGGPNGGVFLDITHVGKDVILDEAAAHVPPVHRVPDARHLARADGGRAHRALLDGRHRGRARDPRHRRRRPVRRGRVHRRTARRQPAGRQLAHRDDRLRQARRRGRGRVLGRLRRRHPPPPHRRGGRRRARRDDRPRLRARPAAPAGAARR